METLIWPRGVKLPKRVEGRPSEDSPETPMEVEEIIHPALLHTILSPDIDMDFLTRIDELEEEEDVLPMEVEENIKPAFLDRDLFLDTYEDLHTFNNEPERVDKLLPLEFMEITENQSKANKPIVLPEEKDAPSSKFTSNSYKTNQTSPDMKILEMPNYTAGTRKTKEFPQSTQSKGYTIINDVIVIDDD
ncbi:uncharacterized protein LOC142138401 isoform X3 [Mixophyes fleayi]|uniref:uncharacterized protein LOC142138401 isoform X3 n=1 Tax=Mixophyes fleayi TaxID=3061075 RepID=UPI003F4E0D3F